MKQEFFPDDTPIEEWFYEIPNVDIEDFEERYVITDYGVKSDGNVYTEVFQQLIDDAAKKGGGVIVVPSGTYMTGALFFKSGVNLYIEENGILKGSDDISDYPIMETRIEGETCKYFPALINADNVQKIAIFGKGTIDGNGLKSWKSFWIRREWNPGCTNKDEQRPRLIYISNCNNVLISGLKLKNSHFWTTHFYRCRYVKIIGCNIFSPVSPVAAPSTDAIDVDVCSDMLIKSCRFEVNDDAIALKGGKGPYADTQEDNGANERIIIENCEYGFCHSCLTCGSESVHNKNILFRDSVADGPYSMLQLKMRPDTPQLYEYITVDNIKCRVASLININPWTQFFDLKGRKSITLSYAENITIRNSEAECNTFFNVLKNEKQYLLSNFTFKNLTVKAKNIEYSDDAVKNLIMDKSDIEKII